MEILKTYNKLCLPQFENKQRIFAEHLNTINEFCRMILLNSYSTEEKKGILKGLFVRIIVDNQEKSLCISPGIAIDGKGQLNILPEEMRIPLKQYEKIPPSKTTIFILRAEYKQKLRTKDNISLGTFNIDTCDIGYVGENEINDPSLVEIARVAFNEAKYNSGDATISDIIEPLDRLRPKPDELDLREVNWIGSVDGDFLRPELQRELAEFIRETTIDHDVTFSINKLSMNQLKNLITTSEFCERGLLSRNQFINFIKIIAEINKRKIKLEGCDSLLSNSELIDSFLGVSRPRIKLLN